jgi:hypothetical protein
MDQGIAPAAEGVKGWRRALSLSNDDRDALGAILEGVAILEGRWGGLGVAAQKRAAASGWFGEALRLGGARDPGRAVVVQARVGELAAEPGGLAPAPLVTGDDLVERGFSPGPLFKRVLDFVYDAQLEGRVRGREEALALAAELGGGSGVV